MTERALKNTWVEIGAVVLQKDERAPNLPDDTKQVPLEMRVKGFLLHDAEKGR
jgi:2-amino-4-ketopentanoate thiolase alpha subunit